MGSLDTLIGDERRTARLSRREEVELAIRVERGDRAARDRMVEANMRLVVTVARRHLGRGLPLEDLVQEGAIGLMRAVELYDHRRGFTFSTYATWWIRQGIQDGLARQARLVRLPQQVERRVGRARAAEARLSRSLGRPPSADEVGAAMGAAGEEIEDLARWSAPAASLDGPAGPGLLARAEGAGPDPEAEALAGERRAVLEREVRRLAPRERDVVRARFGLTGRAERTLADVGAGMGLSRERVRQIERRALDSLALRGPVAALRDAA